ncbi:NACHT, LRR and PYD domains-containing protein 3-like isoform X2 [Polypterus senegalus]|uniref:NACHT, LRR and PYD domains-containing protein 3-like isoform X2 n=1 Tax=Polypterus senegalus TaxID=55291 RepID=UPI001966BE15|nr:NACHT, LRR and PYD domains-containing protein 3-like isoform X2 [Polypterus senegalus]
MYVADNNIMEKQTINVEEEEEVCEWECVHPKVESLVSVNIKEEAEVKPSTTETNRYKNMESVKKDDLYLGCQDGAVTRLTSSQSRHVSRVNIKFESLESDTKKTEEISSVETLEDQPPPTNPFGNCLHELHRLAVTEFIRNLEDQSLSGDPHNGSVDFETRYTELMIIEQDIKVEFVMNGKTCERLEKKGETKNCKRIETEHLFSRSQRSETLPRIVVVTGESGIGKTTMIQKIMFDWANGNQYQRFAFVFLFTFRDLNLLGYKNEQHMSLTKLILRHYKYLSDSEVKEILQKPESLLFLLDGLDEFKHKLDLTQSLMCSDPDSCVPLNLLLSSLISQTLLNGCSVLITSRSMALEALDMQRVDRYVKVVGFVPEQKIIYFKKFFGDTDLGAKAFQYVEENAILYTMCFNPSYCWIICRVLKNYFMTPEEERGPAPRTLTEVYVMFFHIILTNHRQETEDQRKVLIQLAKMAYYAVNSKIRVLNETQEISTFGLQSVITSSFLSGLLRRQSYQEHITYTFYPLALQEFMAAFYFYLDPSEGIEELLVKLDLCKDGQFKILIQFLLGLARQSVFKTLGWILGESERKKAIRILKWMKHKAKQVLKGRDKSEALLVCQWLCETPNKKLIRDSIGKDLEMDFYGSALSLLDCAVLSSVISCCGELKELDLSKTHLTPEFIRRLAPGLNYCTNVMLISSNFTSRCCSALSLTLSSPHSRLTDLDLNYNKLDDSGVCLLCEGLKSANCKLKTLCMVSCALASGCCSALSSALSTPHSQLTELWLDFNDLEDLGVNLLCEGMRSENCKLETLRLNSCRLTSGCCSALYSVLSAPHSHLTILDLGINNLEDKGVHLLCEGLKDKNCKLKTLGLARNGISEKEKWSLFFLENELYKSGRLVYINTV